MNSQTNEGLCNIEEVYNSLFEKSSVVMLFINPSTGQIVDANPVACSYYGWSREEMKKKKIYEINTSSKEETEVEIKKALAEQRNHFFFRHRLANGDIRDVEVFSSPMLMKNGELLFSIVQDVTDNRELSVLVNSAMEDGLWDWNTQSGDAFFNHVYYEMLGYKDKEFIANYASWKTLVHPDDTERVEKDLNESIFSGEKFHIDLRMKMKSGEWLWVSTRGKVIEKDAEGKSLRVVGTLSDITESKNKEEELMKTNSFMMNREVKMIALKEEIAILKGQIAKLEGGK
ncbi:MAG: PAS domain-containing protein [Candidatus Moraniibacteriota bacterium]